MNVSEWTQTCGGRRGVVVTQSERKIEKDEGPRQTVQGHQLSLPIVMYRKGTFHRVVRTIVTNALPRKDIQMF